MNKDKILEYATYGVTIITVGLIYVFKIAMGCKPDMRKKP